MVKRLCSLTICWKKKKKEDLYKDFFKSILKSIRVMWCYIWLVTLQWMSDILEMSVWIKLDWAVCEHFPGLMQDLQLL